jgi:hypothetical protein
LHDVAAGTRVGIVPGKTYEYLGSRRPILAAVPQGDARDLLEAAGTATVCDPGDASAMAHSLERAIERKSARSPLPQPDAGVLRRYERRALTAELASVFDAALGRAGYPIG